MTQMKRKKLCVRATQRRIEANEGSLRDNGETFT